MEDKNSCCDDSLTNLQEETVSEELQEQLEFDFLVNKEKNAEERLNICKQCPELKALNRCRLCGCFMGIKVRIFKSSCPAGKW